ncbi:unnamed protein product [Nippostrongylus brasiliensis]|uniref:Cell wall protein DAN4-like n=1 Tax=Nippostrongylus brasiliensis TaxID=27835 RepID=A0A0N4XRP7_NIPBR|nr:unnamed protein product [Nippostrongylus brasiliensis]
MLELTATPSTSDRPTIREDLAHTRDTTHHDTEDTTPETSSLVTISSTRTSDRPTPRVRAAPKSVELRPMSDRTRTPSMLARATTREVTATTEATTSHLTMLQLTEVRHHHTELSSSQSTPRTDQDLSSRETTLTSRTSDRPPTRDRATLKSVELRPTSEPTRTPSMLDSPTTREETPDTESHHTMPQATVQDTTLVELSMCLTSATSSRTT